MTFEEPGGVICTVFEAVDSELTPKSNKPTVDVSILCISMGGVREVQTLALK